MTAREAAVRRLFARLAPHYALLNSVLSFGLHKLWRRLAMRQVPNVQNQRVLDICAGTGDFALDLQRRGAQVVGVDLAEPMLAIARRRCGPAFAAVVGDVFQLPFADDQFAAATLGFGLRHSEQDLPQLLAEVCRVLAPGATLVVLELSHPPNRLWNWLTGLYIQRLLPLIGATVDPEAYRYLAKSLHGYPNAEELRAVLLGAGFASCEYRLCLGGVAAVHIAVK